MKETDSGRQIRLKSIMHKRKSIIHKWKTIMHKWSQNKPIKAATMISEELTTTTTTVELTTAIKSLSTST